MCCTKDKQKAHKQLIFVVFVHVQAAELCIVFICPPLLSFSLQLALRAPSSHSRGQDYVSNVRSTVAPPSRLPPCVVVGTATTAETWTNRRTCARVSQSLYVRQIQSTEIHKPLRSVAECDRATGRLWHNARWIFGLKLPFADILQHISGWHPISHHWIKGQYLLWCIIPAPNFMHLIQSECAAMFPSLFGDLGSSK